MHKPGVRKRVIGSATLMIDPQRVGPGESAGDLVVNEKGKGGAQAGNEQLVLAWFIEFGKVCFQHVLIRRERKTSVRAYNQMPLEHLLSGGSLEQGET